jgi:hypothetical protein
MTLPHRPGAAILSAARRFAKKPVRHSTDRPTLHGVLAQVTEAATAAAWAFISSTGSCVQNQG